MEKVACFIHSTTMELNKDTFLIELLECLKASNILERLTYLCINNTGLKLDEAAIERKYSPAKVIHCLNTTHEFENPTIKLLYSFCKLNPDYKVLYMHTKGVSYASNHVFLPGVKSWNRFMRHCLLDYFTQCLTLLKIYDTVGCNFRSIEYGNPKHYSGNYWWATARYISTLPIAYLKDKYDPEFWLLQNTPLFFNIITMEEMYEQEHLLENYQLDVKHGIEDNVFFCKVNTDGANMQSQLHCIANVITLAAAQCGNKVVILDDFILNETTSSRVPTNLVLDIPKCNEFLKPYKITLIYKNCVLLEIHKVEYGLRHVNMLDITDKVKSRFLHHNHLFIPIGTSLNDLCGDPCYGMKKQINVHYSLNSVSFNAVFYESNLNRLAPIELKHNCYDGKRTSFVNANENPWLARIARDDSKEMSSLFDTFLANLVLI